MNDLIIQSITIDELVGFANELEANIISSYPYLKNLGDCQLSFHDEILKIFYILDGHVKNFEPNQLFELFKSHANWLAWAKAHGCTKENDYYPFYTPKTIPQLRQYSESALSDWYVKKNNYEGEMASFHYLIHSLTLAARLILIQHESANHIKNETLKRTQLNQFSVEQSHKVNTLNQMAGFQRLQGIWYATELHLSIGKSIIHRGLNPYDFSSLEKLYDKRTQNLMSEKARNAVNEGRHDYRKKKLESLNPNIEALLEKAAQDKQKHIFIVDKIYGEHGELRGIPFHNSSGTTEYITKNTLKEYVKSYLKEIQREDLIFGLPKKLG